VGFNENLGLFEVPYRRSWRKVHLAIDAETLDVQGNRTVTS
jgi:hypothetical protein